MKSFIFTVTGLFVAANFLQAQATQLVDQTFLAALRTEAARKHPATRAASLRVSAAASDIYSLRLWDDPLVGLSLMAAETEKRRADGDIRLGFEQALPKPGLFAANRSKAEALHRAQFENARSTTQEIGTAAARDAIELALADESLVLQAGQIEWLSTMVENARQLAINPDATGLDALRLESELAKQNQILAAAQRSRQRLAQSLNSRLGRPLESPWPRLQLSNNPSPIPIASAEIARISRVNPKLRALQQMASAAKAETQIASHDRQPQLSLAVETDLYSGGDFRSATVGLKMSLPIFNRNSYQAKIEASQLRQQAAVKDLETTRLELAAALLNAVTEATNAEAQARAYSGEIYQRAQQASEAVESSWLSSKSSLTDLLESKRQLFAIRLEQRRFVAIQQIALEEIKLLVPQHP